VHSGERDLQGPDAVVRSFACLKLITHLVSVKVEPFHRYSESVLYGMLPEIGVYMQENLQIVIA